MKITFTSTDLVHAPGYVRWALNARTEDFVTDRQEQILDDWRDIVMTLEQAYRICTGEEGLPPRADKDDPAGRFYVLSNMLAPEAPRSNRLIIAAACWGGGLGTITYGDEGKRVTFDAPWLQHNTNNTENA